MARAIALADDARTAEANDEDAVRVTSLYLEALVHGMAALTLATVHPHLPKDLQGDWRTVAA